MAPPTSPRALFDTLAWQVKGLVATESTRRIGYRARELWQPAEIEARKGIARELATELTNDLRVDQKRGYLMVPHAAIPSIDEVAAIGRAIIGRASLDDGESIGDKKFFRVRVAARQERIALLRIALDRRVLAMAASYLGVLPVITEADYFCSFPVAGPYTKSQLWHCDCDSSDVFKLFIYCDDVVPEDGPLELVDSVSSHRIRDEIGYRYGGRRYRVADDVMSSHLNGTEIVTITGARGTTFAVDTVRCFHRGSRISDAQRRRVMATICYCPPSGSTLPRRLVTASAPLQEFVAEFQDPIQRAVLGEAVATKWL
jgi:hypothetical protein